MTIIDHLFCTASKKGGGSALDGVDFDGFDLDALFFEPGDGFFDFVAFAFQFERDEADFLGDAGLADIGDELEVFAEFPEDRSGDEAGRKHEPEAGDLHGKDC